MSGLWRLPARAGEGKSKTEGYAWAVRHSSQDEFGGNRTKAESVCDNMSFVVRLIYLYLL